MKLKNMIKIVKMNIEKIIHLQTKIIQFIIVNKILKKNKNRIMKKKNIEF